MITTPDDDVTQTTGGTSAVAPPTSRDVDFYFQCAVVVIGIIGTITNGLIIYALVVSKQHKKKFLIFNQNALDFFSSLWLFITYAVKLGNIRLSGLSGYWLCMLITCELLLWAGLSGSKISLAAVTVERYLKVVHNNWSSRWLRNWVTYAVAAFSWIAGFACVTAVTVSTSAFEQDVCYYMAFWESYAAQIGYCVWNFVSFVAILLAIMIYCYGHILVVIRRQARVMAAHSQASASNSARNQTNKKIQSSVTRTMIIVCTFFALCNLPIEIRYLVANLTDQHSYDDFGYYSTLFIMFLFVCINPFVYATKFNPVKRVLLGLIP